MRDFNPEDFIVRYPGVYDEKEKAALAKWWEEADRINHRKPLDVEALVNGTLPKDIPGIGPVLPVTAGMVKYNHEKYEQENPLYNDKEYAVKAGYKDIPAYFVFGAHDDSYTCAFPPEARDTLLVSQACHHVEKFADVYAGDTLFLTIDRRTMIDITPAEGSVYRSCALQNEGTIYNQRCEVVNKVSFHYVESVKTYKEGHKPADFNPMDFACLWEDPDWFAKEDHQYTDADYEYMKSIWQQEEIRGAAPRYWEDVEIGIRIPKTLEGPIIESTLPAAPYGHGIGGTRTMKKEILNEEIFKTMTQDEHGIYRLANVSDYTPEIPDGARPAFMVEDGRGDELESRLDSENDGAETGVETGDIHNAAGDARAAIINFFGRDFAIHCINNWMGNQGSIETIDWSIMAPETHAANGKSVPLSPMFKYHLKNIPNFNEGFMDTHGLTRDIAEVQAEAVDKYIKNGKYIVKLIWWIRDINKRIWIEGSCEVSLPAKEK